MATRPRTTPRKNPRQQRSRETVDAILTATARILVSHGYDHCSTNRVALAAGVSVGSLYQYFPSKEALVAALIDRHNAEMFEIVSGQLVAVAAAPLPDAVRALVAALLKSHEVEPRLHKVLVEQVPRVGRLERVSNIDTQIEALVAAALDARADELRVKDTALAAFLLTRATRAMCFAAVSERPELIGHKAYAEQMSQVVLRYLTDVA